MKVIERFKEPSTWRGVCLLFAALGVGISPEMMEYIVSAGVGLSGLIGLLTSDSVES